MSVAPAAARLLAAEAEATLARQRLQATIAQLQARLDPRLLAREAADAAAEAGQASIETIRRNPLPAAGAAALVGLMLARRPLARLFGGQDAPAAPPSAEPANPAIADPAIPETQA